jgi:hypothetical protein
MAQTVRGAELVQVRNGSGDVGHAEVKNGIRVSAESKRVTPIDLCNCTF